MNILLRRINSESDSTIGYLNIDGKFECFTLEDEYREVKVKGETRIPKGVYEIKKREVLSPMTELYRRSRDWFDWHLELQDVPQFKNIYIHNGSDQGHTDGCLLVGDSVTSNKITQVNNLTNSKSCFERVYKKISKALKTERVMIHIL